VRSKQDFTGNLKVVAFELQDHWTGVGGEHLRREDDGVRSAAEKRRPYGLGQSFRGESSGTAGAREGQQSAWEDAGRIRGHAGEELGEVQSA
jgi:hypothetical protein